MNDIRNWYIIQKTKISKFDIEKHKQELTIHPKKMGDDIPEPMYCFIETSTEFKVPIFYGITHFGEAEEKTNDTCGLVYPQLPDPYHPKAPDNQDLFIDSMMKMARTKYRGTVSAETGTGKCHSAGTEVIMFDGTFKTVEDIKVGDCLLGEDSTPRKVTSLASGQEEMFVVTPINGEPFGVNRSHILSLKISGGDKNRRIKAGNGILYNHGSTIDLSVDDYLKSSKTFRHYAKLFKPDGVIFWGDKKLEIPPYILGLWLGDGTSAKVELTSMDDELIDEWFNYSESFLHTSIRKQDIQNNKASTYSITRGYVDREEYYDDNAHKQFKDLGLLNNKHIPLKYKTASMVERRELLAGLIDSDGHLTCGCYEIVQKNKTISDGLIFVARSLGLRASTRIKVVNGQNYHRVFISGDINQIPVRLPRKKADERLINKDPLVSGFSIESVGIGDYYGFTLADKHRYLLKDFTVTHNTSASLSIIGQLGARALILVPTIRLAEQWQSEIKLKLGLTDDQIGWVQGDICNYKDKHISIGVMDSAYSHQYEKEYYSYHSMVVIDEAHTVVTAMKSQILGMFNAKWQIAMSATLTRKDGRSKVLELWYGPPSVEAKGLLPEPIIITPFPYVHDTPAYTSDRNGNIAELGRNFKRNNKLTDMMKFLYHKDRTTLGIGDSVKQLMYIKNRLVSQGIPEDKVCIFVDQLYTDDKMVSIKTKGINIGVLKANLIEELFEGVTIRVTKVSITIKGNGLEKASFRLEIVRKLAELGKLDSGVLIANMKVSPQKIKVTRQQIDDMLTDQSMRVYLSTYGAMKMGIDVPWLNAGIDLTPRAEARQVMGRIRRPWDDQIARWYTPMDFGFSQIIQNINNARLNDYKKSANFKLNMQQMG